MYGLWLFKELKTEYGYCKIEIYKKSYSGTPIEIEAVEANSLTLSIDNLSETISPIGKSVCSFSIVDTGQLSYDDFFTPDATGIKVVISTINEDRGDVAYTTRWSGFVTPDFYSESLVYRTAINISARDNIGYLSDVEFDLIEPSIQIRELFSKAFAKISEQYPMDVMFRSHKTTEDGILLTDAVISTALFKDKTWGEVLELILHDLGLQMRWVDNNTIAVIDLSQIPEYYLPTQFQFINSSGYREILPAWRGLAQKQEFGIRENSFDGNILPQNLSFVEEIEIVPPSILYARDIKYYTPTNWQTTGDIFTANPNDYGEPFGKRIYFTCANKDDAIVRYMSWRQPITASNSPMKITCKALNTLMIPATKFDLETQTNLGEYLREYIPEIGKLSSNWDGDILQIGIKYNIILHTGLKSYIFKRDWIEIKEDTDLTPNQFILPEIKYTGENNREDPEQPKEEELNIDIVTIPYTGELEFVLYGWEEIERRTYQEETFGKKISWDKFFAYIADVTYTFDGDNKATGQEAKTSINPLHNILRNENYQLGNVPKYGGGIGAYAGGLFNLVGEELSSFKRNEDSPAYNLLELVGREIIHFNKKNYNKLSGEIKSPTKEPLKFNSLFSREGKLYYPFSCSLNVIDNTMTITSMQEVEPYTTESFTEIHSEVKSDGGTTVSGGNNTVLQYSEEAGNAKRLYEMQDATPAEKEKAFALVDSPDFPQARRIRVADLIGLDEQALAQYLELNKYLQENDLTPITNRIGSVEGYFTNGSAKDALKLGGIVAENYWHKGNSGTLDYDWKAKKLNVRTLVIPTSEPTDLSQGEVGFYLGTAGQGAEEPNGSGGLDLTELWAELGSEDYAKKIHISHIPTIQYSSIAGRPSALVNPYALTINGVVYDGSEPISLDISAGGGVADAVAWGNVFNKPTTISGYGITDAYTKDGVDLKLSRYLPKSGGTMNLGYASLILEGQGDDKLIFNNTDGEKYQRIVFKEANTEYGSILVRDTGVNIATPTLTVNWKNVLHSGNYSSYALPLSGGTITGDLTISNPNSSQHTISIGTNNGVAWMGYNADNDLWFVTDRHWYNSYPLIHLGNIGDYALKIDGSNAMTAPLILAHDSSLTKDKGIYVGITNIAGGAAFDYASFVNIHDNRVSSLQLSWYRDLAAPKLAIRISENSKWSAWKTIAFTDSNVASADYATSAGNAEKVAGVPVTFGDNKPWNSIPAITANGYMDVGRHFEFHYDNTTGSDFSTILMCTGNYSNIVYLPSTTGTLALLTDNVASATKLQTARTIWGKSFDGTGDVDGNLYISTAGSLIDLINGRVIGNATLTLETVGTSYARIATSHLGVAYTCPLALNPSGGNVLIGTTEDRGYRLQVEGSFASYSYSDGYGTLGTRPVGASLFGPYVYGLLTWVNGGGNACMQVGRTDNQAIAYNLVMQHLGGNVLIGKTTDNGSKLQVNGAMEATELVIPTAPPTNPQAGKHYLYLA